MGLANSAVELNFVVSVSTVKNQSKWFQAASPLRRRYASLQLAIFSEIEQIFCGITC